MPDLADLFPGYASEWINTGSGRIFARVGGKGPPLLLLHGFSETHVMWHRVAPQLADTFTLIIADLPGYGWSDMPDSDKDHTPYTKRAMAKDDGRGNGSSSATCILRSPGTIAAAACPIASRSIIPAGCRGWRCWIFCRPMTIGSGSTGSMR